jgi:hypothetical protein
MFGSIRMGLANNMENWCSFRSMIGQWARLQISDDQFYDYLVTSEFEAAGDRRLADIYIARHDGGEWSHAIYHRM